jgi:hypothetical protein
MSRPLISGKTFPRRLEFLWKLPLDEDAPNSVDAGDNQRTSYEF